MYENNDYEDRQYKQINESCYRMGVPVDIYIELSQKQDGSLEKHLEKISKLEEEIETSWSD